MNRWEKFYRLWSPSFNVEDTLPQTLNSLLDLSSALLDHLEILVVNDGSKDQTLDIAKSYQVK